MYGFNVGGPVTFGHLYNPDKKRTFFFYNMEWRPLIQGGATNQTVPDTATYGGNLAAMSGTAKPTILFVPSTAQVAPGVLFANCPGQNAAGAGVVQGQPFPGNVIPSCMINPNAAASAQGWHFPGSDNKYYQRRRR